MLAAGIIGLIAVLSLGLVITALLSMLERSPLRAALMYLAFTLLLSLVLAFAGATYAALIQAIIGLTLSVLLVRLSYAETAPARIGAAPLSWLLRAAVDVLFPLLLIGAALIWTQGEGIAGQALVGGVLFAMAITLKRLVSPRQTRRYNHLMPLLAGLAGAAVLVLLVFDLPLHWGHWPLRIALGLTSGAGLVVLVTYFARLDRGVSPSLKPTLF